ncbi:MAG: ATP-binding cassette domain-containing protein [Microthrixaceae bacterium]
MAEPLPGARTSVTADVRVLGVSKSFDGSTNVLQGVDVDVDAGATLALLGPSGCGKTTLLRIIAGLDRPDDGTVSVGGRTLTGPSTMVPPERRRVGMVFQDWALFPHLSVSRNVGFGLPRQERRRSPRIDEALELVGLSSMGDRMPATLSGGQQQRAWRSLARSRHGRRFCCWTSRSRTWTPRCAHRCEPRSTSCWSSSGSRRSS